MQAAQRLAVLEVQVPVVMREPQAQLAALARLPQLMAAPPVLERRVQVALRQLVSVRRQAALVARVAMATAARRLVVVVVHLEPLAVQASAVWVVLAAAAVEPAALVQAAVVLLASLVLVVAVAAAQVPAT